MLATSRRTLTALVVTCLLVLAVSLPAAAYEPNPNAPRSEVPADYQWRPQDVFPSTDAWEQEVAAIQEGIPALAQYEGHLGDSAETLLTALQSIEDMYLRLMKALVYAQFLYDVDQGNSDARARQGRVAMIMPQFGRTVSYLEPEILQIDEGRLEGFLAESAPLRVYDYYLKDMRRLKDHTLSPPEEKILALTGNLRSVPGDAHESLLGVDVVFPKIVDADGNEVELTVSGFSKYRSGPVYNVRKQAADAFFSTLRSYENTFATLLDGVVKAHILSKEARGYSSCLEASLMPDNISVEAYDQLVQTINDNLPRTLHKYIALRRKVLGLDGPVTFPNLYNSMIEDVDQEWTYEQGRDLILTALKPLGQEYVSLLAEGTDPHNGWIDIYPNADKRSGAYSNGSVAADVHPFVLHNFDNTLDAVFTTAHEFGHALHSYYSSHAQPPIYRNYTTFLAEVASTSNEALLMNHLLKQTKDPAVKLMLLNQRLESIRLTIFRQTLFAEFEKRFHEYAEQGNPLTADYLNGLYAELIQKYYGPDFQMGENDETEWMFIPHFYYNFYVFSYATGLTSGLSIAQQIEKEGQKASRRYIDEMLKAGNSAPPLEILRRAGVDLETPAPILDMLDLFEQTVDEFDGIWTKNFAPKEGDRS